MGPTMGNGMGDMRGVAGDRSGAEGAGILQLVSFRLGEQTYAIDIMMVREIKVWTEATPLPNTPSFVRGVINLRGLIVPVFDLRDRFGQGRTETTRTHVVVVVSVEGRTLGILVDAVSDILTVPRDGIRPVPDADPGHESAFLSGLVTVGEEMVALIAPARLFSREVVTGVHAGSGEATDRAAQANG
ncbi:chemotaxis protein CheW [Caenispirillum bisanense]|uniref:Purine-binding chemotaxis protein CheW n=1 Tax=Caenispirillum bisanense TaxID=414052 RepID=A0A286G424_9PROT|nr:chemotaxis protein CheW [Caenispirillum bisanense]SOD90243.1 purine-binding chemotaxis protein CheW [Caenispirillum bisanense]